MTLLGVSWTPNAMSPLLLKSLYAASNSHNFVEVIDLVSKQCLLFPNVFPEGDQMLSDIQDVLVDSSVTFELAGFQLNCTQMRSIIIHNMLQPNGTLTAEQGPWAANI